MLLVTFAVPHESRYFRRTAAARQVRIVHTGIGEEAARHAIRKALVHERPGAVISSGFAGGLDSSLKVGGLIADAIVSSPDLLLTLPPSVTQGRVYTAASPVDSPEAKAKLHSEGGALAVDMETKGIAAECRHAGVPLLVLRAISDAASDSIPIPLEIAWDIERHTPRPLHLVSHLALHPGSLLPFVQFIRKTNDAARSLGAILPQIVAANSAQDCQ